jgi:hypothetical protein
MIAELTPEQEALIPVYREKWRAIALSTERIDRQKAANAIRAAYSIIGFEEPETIFCDSPSKAYSQLKDHPLNSLARCFEEQLRDNQHIQLMGQVQKGLWVRLVSSLSVNFAWNLLEPLYTKLGDQIINELEGQIFPSFASERWVSPACWFDFFITVLNCQSLSGEWMIFQELIMECGWIFPFEGICLICDRPTKLTFDDQGRLHADKEPAIEFADGFCVYAQHGELVTEPDRS